MEKAATILNAEKAHIMDLWEAEVNKKISASENAGSLALRDHLPQLLDDIINIMANYKGSEAISDEERYNDIAKHSVEHGRHRASTSNYTITQILHEYIIFHRILTEILTGKDAYTKEVGASVKFSIENSMLHSAKAFNASLQEMREKLIGILAHDMRNPISAALFAVDLLSSGQDKQRFEKLQTMAHNSLKRSLDLIENLLDSVTVGAGEGMTLDFAEGDIIEFIDAVYEEASEVYTHTIEFEKPIPEIKGVFDGTMIRRMVENLLSNAVKYGSRDTPVTLMVEDMEETVILKVHNFGNPIPEQNQKRIFQFLKRNLSNGDRELKSWGMGLTLVRAVAEAHGGKVEIQSNLEDGTTFIVHLKKFRNRPGKKRAALNFR